MAKPNITHREIVELQARLCKDSISEATDCKAMTLDEFRVFRSQIEESNEKLFTT